MRTRYGATLVILGMLAFACAPKVNEPADVQAVKKAVDDFAKAFNAGDANGIAALMTDKTAFANLNVPVAVGQDAIRSDFQAFFDQFKGGLSTPAEDVRVTGDLAVARGTWTDRVTPKAEGVAPIDYRGSWMATFTRQSDGSWKWDSLVANSDQPVPGSTATGEDEKALLQLERDWSEAFVRNDAAALDRILADEFQANYASLVANKKQILAVVKSGSAKTQSSVTSEMKALVLGDTAVVHGLTTEKSSIAGRDMSGRYRFTDVFVKRDGRWQCVTGYSAKVQ